MAAMPPLRELLSGLPVHKQAAATARAVWLQKARPSQIPPPGDWFAFVALAGRGWGKTQVGAAEAVWHASWNDGARVAAIGPTAGDLRRTLFEGTSGLLSAAPPECLEGGSVATAYNRSLFELKFANGSLITGFSAAEPDRLRGSNNSFAWADEVAGWEPARMQETWDMLALSLRAGRQPRVIVTTTPKPTPLLRNLLARSDVRVVRGSSYENAANLAPGFIAQLRARYEGTRLGAQELHAQMLTDLPNALWTHGMIDAARLDRPRGVSADAPGAHRALTAALGLRRMIVAVDPSGAAGADDETADEIGIVVAGVSRAGRGFIIEDGSARLSPEGWGRKAVELYEKWGADRIVAERNYGGEMVAAVIRAARRNVPVTLLTASRGKVQRAEPVAALYEQGRVHHVGTFAALEDQLCAFTSGGYQGPGSPDRADAAIWALSELLLNDTSMYDTSLRWVG